MNATTDATAKLETLADDAQKTAAEHMEKTAKSLEGAASFNRDNMDAVMKAAGAAMKSAEEINAEMMAYSKKSMEEGVAAAKEIASSKTMSELVEKQADFAKSAFDGIFKQMTRMNELALAAAKEAMQPLAGRMNAAADEMKPTRA